MPPGLELAHENDFEIGATVRMECWSGVESRISELAKPIPEAVNLGLELPDIESIVSAKTGSTQKLVCPIHAVPIALKVNIAVPSGEPPSGDISTPVQHGYAQRDFTVIARTVLRSILNSNMINLEDSPIITLTLTWRPISLNSETVPRIGPLRFGYLTDDGFFRTTSPATRAVLEIVYVLREQGRHTIPFVLPPTQTDIELVTKMRMLDRSSACTSSSMIYESESTGLSTVALRRAL
ncbi:hypothetical protein BJ742DRAFT_865848 [Cladochytrium replicatum]|nr:hypothetical protein BJ742DRAFT_865848 [Cladochytrium replicatum]